MTKLTLTLDHILRNFSAVLGYPPHGRTPHANIRLTSKKYIYYVFKTTTSNENRMMDYANVKKILTI